MSVVGCVQAAAVGGPMEVRVFVCCALTSVRLLTRVECRIQLDLFSRARPPRARGDRVSFSEWPEAPDSRKRDMCEMVAQMPRDDA